MYTIPESLAIDIENYETLVHDFIAKKIEPLKFKVTRVPMGIYEQRKDGTFMVRIRCTGGFITPSQLKQVAVIAQKYQSSLIHITTRQEIQIQNISLINTVNVVKELAAIGLSSRGGGGNTVRNIMSSIDSGIQANEVFDVYPYAIALTNKLIAESDSWTLPRKFKIAFSNSEHDNSYATFNDLGFVAKEQNGIKGFAVYLGGSLGSKPMVSPELFSFVPATDIFVIADAAKKLFSRYGNRKNKHKARLRYVFFKHGKIAVFNLFNQILEEVKSVDSAEIVIPTFKFSASKNILQPTLIESSDFDFWKSRYVKTQKQQGLYSVIVPFLHGNISAENVLKLGEFLENFGDDSLRFSMRQNIYLRNIPEQFLGNIYTFLLEIGVKINESVLANSLVSCTGADTCRLGICLAKGALTKLNKELNKSDLDLDNLSNFRINISGCPNSCGQQVAADLGFYGAVGRNDRMYPAYKVVAGAVISSNNAKLAEPVGEISGRDLPVFTVQVLEKYLAMKNVYKTFAAYIDAEGKDDIAALCEVYKIIPEFEEDKNYYFDWGSDQIFSLVGRGLGECSAGLFDLIDLDMNSIALQKDIIAQLTDSKLLNQALHTIVYASSRMLLITKGIEPSSDMELYSAFVDHFINAGLINSKYALLIEKVKLNHSIDLQNDKELIFELSRDIVELYENMDDSLQFKVAVALPVIEQKESNAIKYKDLRGVKCPMNFVKTKIELSMLKSGDLLEILLDDGDPIENVPGSVKAEGHAVLEQEKMDEYWRVKIQKA